MPAEDKSLVDEVAAGCNILMRKRNTKMGLEHWLLLDALEYLNSENYKLRAFHALRQEDQRGYITALK